MIDGKPDILSVIQRDLDLRQRGRDLWACCPFHEDKTPSFRVSPERQTWWCFGACSTGGDVIDYIVKRDGVSFKDALRTLGIRRGRPARPDPAVVRERERKRAFEAWRRSYLWKLSDQAAEIHRMIREAKADPGVSELVAWNYASAAGELAEIEHRLDILCSRDGEAIDRMYSEVLK